MTLKDLDKVHVNVWYNICGKDYKSAKRNCKHYAKSVYNYIKKYY